VGFWRSLGTYFGVAESPERRSAPPIPSNGSLGWTAYSDVFNGLRSPDQALQQVAVWAAQNLIATQGSTLPFDVYSRSGDDRRPVETPAWLDDIGGDGYGTHDWIYQYLMSALSRGNVYGKVVARDERTGAPRQIVLHHPDDVQGWRDPQDGMPRWRVAGIEVADGADVWHQRAYVMPGRLLGLSPIEHHALTIGLGLAAAKFGAQWFTDGAHPSGILTNEEVQLDETTAKVAKQRFMANLRGSREPATLGRGWKFQTVQVNAEESQFLATQRYSSAECARIFGPALPEILGYETGGSMTYANVEQRNLDLLTYSIDPWLTRIERAFSRMLPPGQYLRFNRAALLRTDTKSRYEAHGMALRDEWKTIDEVRSVEDMGPVPWGSLPVSQRAGGGDLDPKELGNLIQSIYLGVNKVITWEEARRVLLLAGAPLDPNAPPPPVLVPGETSTDSDKEA
jgi:HK97 family phage portal protein